MKTDRFDEELRRKLQDLPVDADKADVERTFAYIRTNNPVVYGIPWSKLLLFGIGGLLLFGSLLYNGIQYIRTTQLQTSVDSLSSQSTSQAVRPDAVQHDTIYITRSEQTEPFSAPASPDGSPEQAAQSAPRPSAVLPSVSHTVDEATPGGLASRAGRHGKGTPIGTSRLKPSLPSDGSVDADPSTERPSPRSESVNAVESELSGPSLSNRLPRPAGIVARRTKIPATPPLPDPGTDVLERSYNTESTNRPSVMTSRSGRQRRGGGKDNRLAPPGQQVSTMSSINSSDDEVTAETTRPVTAVEMIATRPLNLAGGSPGSRLMNRSLTTPKTAMAAATRPAKRAWHLTMPRLSVPNAQYRVGTSLLGGPDQLGGAMLGELQINPHWSVQAGIQVILVDGFHYRDEQDFGKHRNNNFRQTYGVQAPTSADIEDINLRSTLFQLPVQIAYHYPLGRQWGLRIGLGTDLTLGTRSTVDYNYRENNRSTEHEQETSNGSATGFNNLTMSTSLERAWKRWQFRAGPFISPQIRSVSYKSDDQLWGGNVQVFYRLRK